MTKIRSKGAPMPSSVGACADEYHATRELRLAMDKEVAAVKARESELREHIITELSASDDTGAAGKRYRAQIVTKSQPRVEDWAALHKFIKKTGRFDLLQKRISTTAAMDMLEADDDLPGVERMRIKDVSITKI